MLFEYSYMIAFVACLVGIIIICWQKPKLHKIFYIIADIYLIILTILATFYLLKLATDFEFIHQNILHYSFISLEWRYMKWAITMSLLIITFPLLMRPFLEKSQEYLYKLPIIMLVMMVFAYLGEHSYYSYYIMGNKALIYSFIFFVMWIGLFILLVINIYILISQYFSSNSISTNTPEETQLIYFYFNFIFYIITIGWSIYPLGYIFSLILFNEASLVAKEIIYSLSDMINIILFMILSIEIAILLSSYIKNSPTQNLFNKIIIK